MKLIVFAFVLIAISIAGCLAPSNSSKPEYEFWGLGTNSTTFYLDTDVKTVHAINSTSTFEVEISGFSGGFQDSYGIENTVAIGYYGAYQGSLTNLTYNVTKDVRRGKKYLRFSFEQQVTGFLAYTEASQQQEFTRTLSKEGKVRIVLPENYTTGNLFLGIARPPPDSIQVNKSREVLIWDSPYPIYKSISVKYYPKWAPNALGFFALFLSLCALAFGAYYYYGIETLKKRRKEIERDVRKR